MSKPATAYERGADLALRQRAVRVLRREVLPGWQMARTAPYFSNHAS